VFLLIKFIACLLIEFVKFKLTKSNGWLPVEIGTLCSEAVKALRYKPESHGFETRLGDFFFFSIYVILPAALGPGVYSASNRNEYQYQKK
jgi:hypothetical protein